MSIAARRKMRGVGNSPHLFSWSKPLMGASTSDNTKFNTLNASVGPLACRRTYASTLPASFTSSQASPDIAAGRRSYWSWKPNPATFANDTALQASFSSFLDTVPINHKLTIFAWHEPEDNISGGEFTLAQFGSMTNRMGEIIHSKNRPSIRMGVCFMGPWTFDSRSRYYSYDWDSAINWANVDMVGIDPYRYNSTDSSLEDMLTINNYGSGTGGNTLSVMERIAEWNKPVGLMEWGCTESDVTIADKAAWITAGWNFMKAWNADPNSPIPIESAVYFNNNLDVAADPRTTWELSGSALTAFKAACADSRA